MSFMDARQRADLDRWITGDYGQRQFDGAHPEDCTGTRIDDEPDYDYDPETGQTTRTAVRVECTDPAHDVDRFGPSAYRNEDGDVRVRGCESHGALDPTDDDDRATLGMCPACRHESSAV